MTILNQLLTLANEQKITVTVTTKYNWYYTGLIALFTLDELVISAVDRDKEASLKTSDITSVTFEV